MSYEDLLHGPVETQSRLWRLTRADLVSRLGPPDASLASPLPSVSSSGCIGHDPSTAPPLDWVLLSATGCAIEEEGCFQLFHYLGFGLYVPKRAISSEEDQVLRSYVEHVRDKKRNEIAAGRGT